MCSTIELVPVSQWVYNLYKVFYWSKDPAIEGARQVRSSMIAASSENHLISDVWDLEYAPHDSEYATWEVARENVGHPLLIGKMYGRDVYENGNIHGRRLAGQM